MLCEELGTYYVWVLVCVLCVISSVSCAVFSLCHVQFAVTNLVASLRACLAALGRVGPNKGTKEEPKDRTNKGPKEGPIKGPMKGPKGRAQ